MAYVHITQEDTSAYTTIEQGRDLAADFLDSNFGRSRWQYANQHIFFTLPEIAENSSYIPTTIGSNNPADIGKFSEIAVYIEKHVYILDSAAYHRESLPRFWQHHTLGKVYKHSNKALKFEQLARYTLADKAYPYVSTRFNFSDYHIPGDINMFAVFIPEDRKKTVMVIKPGNKIHVSTCSPVTHIIVDGKWPRGLKTVYEH